MANLETVTTNVNRRVIELIVFPIIKALYYANGTEAHKLVGTGFFFDSDGQFLTARHVFEGRESAVDLEGASRLAVYCVHSVHMSGKPVARYIDVPSVRLHSNTDIAIGRVEPNQFGRGDQSITEHELSNTAHFNYATSKPLPVGTRIWTVAYPLATVSDEPGHVHIHAQSDSFSGSISKHYPHGRDSGLLSWPCYETDMEILGGASGGPVFISGSSGVVFGVNCTGTDPYSVSHVTSLAPLISKSGAA